MLADRATSSSTTETQGPHAPHPPPILYPRARVVGLTTNGEGPKPSAHMLTTPRISERLLVCGSASTPPVLREALVFDYVEALRRVRYGAARSPGHLRCTVLHSIACYVRSPDLSC